MLVLLVGLWTALLGAWLTLGRPASWDEWLAGMNRSAARSKHRHRTIGQPDAAAAKLTYLGEGRAELGDFSIRIFQPITRSTLRADFSLEGKTACADRDAFDKFIRSNHRFLREQVMVTVRNCESDDLVDPDLQLLEKKLVSRVNRALGRRFLESAQIKEFCLYESVESSAFVPREHPGSEDLGAENLVTGGD